ncbi:MAG: hypothetical protein K2O66_01425, partial [Bacteroidales bacterium]|nr:hypothetical protein [Bacteroidales bacterium]
MGDSMAFPQTPCRHIYYLYQISGNCKSATVKVEVFVGTVPEIDFIDAIVPSSCDRSDGIISIYATGDTTLEYSAFVPQKFGIDPDFIDIPNGTYPLAVRTVTGCYAYDTVELYAFNTPDAPPIMNRDTTYCAGAPRQPLEVKPYRGGVVTWFDDLTLQHAVYKGNPYNISSLPANTYLFSAVEAVGTCNSKPATVKVKILPSINTGVAGNVYGCPSGTVTVRAIHYDEVSYTWVDPSGMTVSTTDSMTVNVPDVPEVYTLHATLEVDGYICDISQSVTIQYTTDPVYVDTTACVGDTIELTVANGTAFAWPDSSTQKTYPVVVSATKQTVKAWVLFANGCRMQYVFTVSGRQGNPTVVGIEKDFDLYCTGDKLQLKAKLSDASVPVSLQWSKDGEDIADATAQILDVSGLEAGSYTYAITATAKEFCTKPRVTADTVRFDVYPTPVVKAGPDIDSLPYGEKTVIGIQADVTDGTEPYTYLWTGTGVGADNNRITIGSERIYNTTVVTLTATDSVGCSASDDLKISVVGGPFRITMDKPYNLAIDKNADTICLGDTALLRVNAAGGSGNYAYTWKELSTGDVLGTDAELKTTPVVKTQYEVTVINLTGSGSTSADTLNAQVVVGVHLPPVAGYISTPDTTMCADTAYTLTLNAYRGQKIVWEQSIDTVVWNTLSGAADTNRIKGSVATTYYRATVYNGVCPVDVSPVLKVQVYEAITNLITAPEDKLCPETQDVRLTGNTVTSGGNGTYTYTWQASTVNKETAFTTAPFDSGNTFYVWKGAIDSTRYFRRVVYSDGCPFVSEVVTVDVYDDSHIGIIEGENYICIDSVGTMAVTNKQMETYRWQRTADTSARPVDWKDIAGAIMASYNTDPVGTDTLHYRAIGSKHGCAPDTTPVFTIIPTEPLPTSVFIGVDTSAACIGNWLVFTVDSTNYPGNKPVYSWYVNGTALNLPLKQGKDTLAYASKDGITFYTRMLEPGDSVQCGMASSIGCVTEPLAMSNAVKPTIYLPLVKIAEDDLTFCRRDTVAVHADSAVYHTWTYKGTSDKSPLPLVYAPHMLDSYDSVVKVSPVEITTYYVEGIDRHGCIGVDSVTLTPEPLVTATPDTLLCAGSKLALKAIPASTRGVTYSWTEVPYHSSTPATLPAKTTLNTLTGIQPLDSLTYYIYTIKTPKCTFSDTIRVMVEQNTTPVIDIDYTGSVTGDTAHIIECEKIENFFYYTSQYGGDEPKYTWYFNGEKVGTDSLFSDTYQYMVDQSTIYVEMESSKRCVTDRTVKSDQMKIHYVKMPEAVISINSNKGLSVCPNEELVLFQAHAPTYDTGIYQWYVKYADSAQFVHVYTGDSMVASFATGDQVYCVYVAQDSCIKYSPKRSNTLVFSNYKLWKPTVDIIRLDAGREGSGDTVCEMTDVLFEARITEAGTDYRFTWLIDGQEVGTANNLKLTYGDFMAQAGPDYMQSVVSARLETKHSCAVPSNINTDDTIVYVRPRKSLGVTIDQDAFMACNSLKEEPVIFTHVYGGLAVNGNSIANNCRNTEWNTGAVSQQTITGNGSVSAKATSVWSEQYEMFGLTSRSTVSHYSHLDYAVYFENGTVAVYEDGARMGAFGSYTSADVLTVEIADSVVRYLKNGVVFHTSAKRDSIGTYWAGFSLYSRCNNCGHANHDIYSALNSVTIEYRASGIAFGSVVVEPPVNTPTYDWKINGVSSEFGNGKDSLIDHKYHFVDNDVVSLIVTSNDVCMERLVAESNPITVRMPEPGNFLRLADTAYVCLGDSVWITAGGAASYEWTLPVDCDPLAIHDSSLLVWPKQTTTYRVTAASEDGCVDFKRIVVVVFELPQPDLGPDKDVCIGDSLYFSVAAGREPDSITDRIYRTEWTFITESTGYDTLLSAGTGLYDSIVEHTAFVSTPLTSSHSNALDLTALKSGKVVAKMINLLSDCYATDTLVLNVYPLPEVDMPSDTLYTCISQNLDIKDSAYDQTAKAEYRYTWTPVANLTKGTASGSYMVFNSSVAGIYTYYVDVVTPKGCHSYDTVTVRNVEQILTATAELVRGTVCEGEAPVFILTGEWWLADATATLYRNGKAVETYTVGREGQYQRDTVVYTGTIATGDQYYFDITSKNTCLVQKQIRTNIDTLRVVYNTRLGSVPDSLCSGKPLVLNALPVQDSNVHYTWTLFGANGLSDTATAAYLQRIGSDTSTITVPMPDADSYFSVTADGGFGCVSSDTVSVGVIHADTLVVELRQQTDSCQNPSPKQPEWASTGNMVYLGSGQIIRDGNSGSGWQEIESKTALSGNFMMRYVVSGKEAPAMVGINYQGRAHWHHSWWYGNWWCSYDADHAFYLSLDNGKPYLQIYERGGYIGTYGEWSEGNILFIVRQAGYVSYYKNEELLRRVQERSPSQAFTPEVSTYSPGTAVDAIDYVELPQIDLLTSAGTLSSPLSYKWYCNGKLVATDSAIDTRTIGFQAGDTVVYQASGQTKCDGLQTVSDTVVIAQIQGYRPVFMVLEHDGQKCENEGFWVHSTIVNRTESIPDSVLRYNWYRGAICVASGVRADSMYFDSVGVNEYVWAQVYVDSSYSLCIFNSISNPVRSPLLFLPVTQNRVLGVNIDVYPGPEVCLFSEVRFNSVQVISGTSDAGENPVTEWYLNDRLVYTGQTYVTDSLQNGDSVYAVITASTETTCLDTNRKQTPVVHMTVLPAPVLEAYRDTIVEYDSEVDIWAVVTQNWESDLTYEWYPAFDVQAPWQASDSAVRVRSKIDHYYTVQAKNSIGCVGNQAGVHVEVLTCPQFVLRGSETSACAGDTAYIYLQVQGFRPYTNTYIWQLSNDGGLTWKDLELNGTDFAQKMGENDVTLVIPETKAEYDKAYALFRCLAVATDERLDCDTVASNSMYLDVVDYKKPTTSITGDTVVCRNTPVQFTATGAVNPGDYYQWYRGGKMVGGTDNTLSLDSVSGNESIMLVLTVRNDENQCVDRLKVSDTLEIRANPTPYLTMSPDTAVNKGDDALVYVHATGGVEPYTYKWNGLPATTLLTPNKDSSFTRKQLYTTRYTVTVTDRNGCSNTGSVDVRIGDTCLIEPAIYGPQTICLDSVGLFEAFITGGLSNSDMQLSWTSDPVIDSTILMATGPEYRVKAFKPGTYTITLTVSDSSEIVMQACPASQRAFSVSREVTVYPAKRFSVAIDSMAPVCTGTSSDLQATAYIDGEATQMPVVYTQMPVVYTWYRLRDSAVRPEMLQMGSRNTCRIQDWELNERIVVEAVLGGDDCQTGQAVYDTLYPVVNLTPSLVEARGIYVGSHERCRFDTAAIGLTALFGQADTMCLLYIIDGGETWSENNLFKPVEEGSYLPAV